jgi:NAD(P)-dependent dehydrogenase (short-subunit alcohol dehydrogenase family)
VFVTRALLPMLRRSAAGSVIYLSALDGLFGNPDLPAWSATKGALVPFTHVMAHNCAPDGIRVNCIASAFVDQVGPGDPHPASIPTSIESILAATPLHRRGEPHEVASVAAFFASDDASYVTGTVLPVDGGRRAVTPGTWHSS